MKVFENYLSENGDSPIEDFLRSINKKDAQKILAKVKWASEQEIFSPKIYKKFKGYAPLDIGELIIGDFRIIISKTESDHYILLHGFRKQTMETPEREITIAIKRLNQYLYKSNYESKK